jgi:transcription initiation factor TFIIIB Brf1 subunit/transcription initiation factor TFIIB
MTDQYIHIYAPPREIRIIQASCCPDCQRTEPAMVDDFTDGYNAAEVVCLCCGNGWSEGKLCPKPFERGWRQRRIADAIRRFNADRGIV